MRLDLKEALMRVISDGIADDLTTDAIAESCIAVIANWTAKEPE